MTAESFQHGQRNILGFGSLRWLSTQCNPYRFRHFKPHFPGLESVGDIHISHSLSEGSHRTHDVKVTVRPNCSSSGSGEFFFDHNVRAYTGIHIVNLQVMLSGKDPYALLVVGVWNGIGRDITVESKKGLRSFGYGGVASVLLEIPHYTGSGEIPCRSVVNIYPDHISGTAVSTPVR